MAQRICPICGHIENEYTYFCTECGAKTELSQRVGSSSTENKSSIISTPKQEPIEITPPVVKHEEKPIEEKLNEDNSSVEEVGVIETANNEYVEATTDNVAYVSNEPQIQNIDKNSSLVKSANNQRTIIIALSAVVAVLLIVVVCFAVSSSKNNRNNYAVATTESDESEAQEPQFESVDYDESSSYSSNQETNYEIEEASQDVHDYSEENDDSSEVEQGFDDDGIHSYDLIVKDCTWSEAFNECIRRGGYLARITSDEEFVSILQQIYNEDKGKIKFWIAGACDDGRYYHWVYPDGSLSDESINNNSKYDNYWLTNEPSFYDDATECYEDRMNMFYVKSEDRWIWNDVPDDVLSVASFYSGSMGYICEYE